MGNGMNRILPGLYVGNIYDAKDKKQLEENNITHVLSIHNYNKNQVDEKIKYLVIHANDSPDQDLTQFFSQCIDFIHQARISGGNVLVHCLAGISRSVTISAAYIMTVTTLTWRDSINAIRGARTNANPNFGFQKQLQKFAEEDLQKEKDRLSTMFEPSPYNDAKECRALLKSFQTFVMFGDRKEKSDGLYPLPYKSYGEKDKTENRQKVIVGEPPSGLDKTEDEDVSSSNAGACAQECGMDAKVCVKSDVQNEDGVIQVDEQSVDNISNQQQTDNLDQQMHAS